MPVRRRCSSPRRSQIPCSRSVSLNRNGYAFDQDFEILSLGGVDGNACGYWGCGGAVKEVVDLGGGVIEYRLIANNVGGTEPHGALRFTGAFDTVTWRSLTNEYWNGFTVGVQGTAIEVPPCDIDPTCPECGPNAGSGTGHAGVARHRSAGLGTGPTAPRQLTAPRHQVGWQQPGPRRAAGGSCRDQAIWCSRWCRAARITSRRSAMRRLRC